jgi:hypothetical protein
MEMTITYKGVEFDVEFDYQPEEAEVLYDSNGTGDPGCSEEISIYKISHMGVCFTEVLESNSYEIEEVLSKTIHDLSEY